MAGNNTKNENDILLCGQKEVCETRKEMSEGAQDSKPKTIVLAGNPNVGKSVFFGAMTNTYAAVSNFPGTTVEILEAPYKDGTLIDSPGVYGLSNLSTEEDVTRDVLLKADTVINIVDMTHLERDLFFTLQLVDMGLKLIVVLNMRDEAAAQGVVVDRDLLSDLLGVPVITAAATKGEGIKELEEILDEAMPGHSMAMLRPILIDVRNKFCCGRQVSQAELVLALEGDKEKADYLAGITEFTGDLQEEIYTERRLRANDIIGHVMHSTTLGADFKTKLSAAMMRPITGVPMLLALFAVLWVVVGQWVGTDLVDFLEATVMQSWYIPMIQDFISGLGLSADSVIYKYISGEFGLLTMVPTYLLGVIFPLIAAFYLMLSLLEDSGYLPRIAVLTDRLLTRFGLNGRAVIPLILGFGCVTMGTLTTRVLTSKRERVIATALLAIAVPCSAQIAVIIAMMSRAPMLYSAIFITFIVLVFGVVGLLLNKLVPGESSGLLIDLPPLRMPKLKNIFEKTSHKVVGFMKEIFLFFVAGSLIITTLQVTGALGWIINAAAPLTVGWLGLPAEAAQAFVMGFIRRDFGAAGFFNMQLTNAQLLVGMSAITLFVPCIATALVVLKERGVLYFTGLMITSIGLAFLLGGLMMRALVLVGL